MAFSQGATGLSPLPSCFEVILVVTVHSVQGTSSVSGMGCDIRVFLNCGTTPGYLLEVQIDTDSS